ncbi:hypothetical protein B5Z21_18005 [Bacillus velezensis]|nr:hypothetical protein B9C53_09585 [Bacillus velezensis]OMQ01797.1 hypothetical protein BXO87_19475 [Bacillus sp. GZB]OQV45791.1 hypothetical protein B5Z21_18005 [Bacillus velezensis]
MSCLFCVFLHTLYNMRNVTICLFVKVGFMLVQSGNNRDRAIQLKNFTKHLIVRLKSNIVKVNKGGG